MMRQILLYELKKILERKITWAAFAAALVFQTVMAFAGNLGTNYIDGELFETHAQRNEKDRAYGIAMSGRVIDGELLKEIAAAYEKVDTMNSERHYKGTETYQKEVRPYEGVIEVVENWARGFTNEMAEQERLNGSDTAEKLYESQKLILASMEDTYGLSEKERDYWETKAESLPDRYTYQYCTSWQYIISMNGMYMSGMMAAFFIAICMGTVFSDEHVRRTDQLILSTRNGRRKLYAAKILAGSAVSFAGTLILALVVFLGNFNSYGPEGVSAAIQMMAGWYPADLTVGETVMILLGLLLLSSVLIGIFVMVLAELMRNSIGAMAVVIGLMFLSRLVGIPVYLRVLSQLWNYMPLNILKFDQGFCDLRLLSLPGIQLTSWQTALVLYVALGVLLYFAGKRIFSHFEVKGR